jgi:hypothetical protein
LSYAKPKICVLDLNQLQLPQLQLHPDFSTTEDPQLQQHADRLLKDNFALDPDLLCCTVVKTLYVKGEIYLGLLHLILGNSFTV